ncbi:MAG: hypothetical protein AAFQ82_17090 [Myxococcota bacterium]
MLARSLAASVASLLLCNVSLARTSFVQEVPRVEPIAFVDSVTLEIQGGERASIRAGAWTARCLRSGVALAVVRSSDRQRVIDIAGVAVPECVSAGASPDSFANILQRVASLERGHVVMLAAEHDAAPLLAHPRVRAALLRLGGDPKTSALAWLGATQLPEGFAFEASSQENRVVARMLSGALFRLDPSSFQASTATAEAVGYPAREEKITRLKKTVDGAGSDPIEPAFPTGRWKR